MTDNQIAVYMDADEQAIAMFVGSGTVYIARDHQEADWDLTDTQRAVLVARLRSVADRIERAEVTP